MRRSPDTPGLTRRPPACYRHAGIEDMVTQAMPGMPKVIVPNPVLAHHEGG